MDEIFNNIEKTLNHLRTLHNTFSNPANFPSLDNQDFQRYLENLSQFESIVNTEFTGELYKKRGRQMILADFVEYIFLGRMYLKLKNRDDKENFTRAILRFVNLLMLYETLTISDDLRRVFITSLGQQIDTVSNEELFADLRDFIGTVGLPEGRTDAGRNLNQYFDTLLPKTAGGLWHELLVFIFMLRSDFGYIIPLLLSQRLIGLEDHIVPPDFLVLGKDKRIYGVEVGTKKEIQSGAFSIRSGIPTATIDTINSRNSDRCPICNKWILFCPYVITKYSDFNFSVQKSEVRCLQDCDVYTREQISAGECTYIKYSRKRTVRGEHTHHEYSNGYHYHYKCVLENVPQNIRDLLSQAEDTVALKTHFPYYAGLEYLNDA